MIPGTLRQGCRLNITDSNGQLTGKKTTWSVKDCVSLFTICDNLCIHISKIYVA